MKITLSSDVIVRLLRQLGPTALVVLGAVRAHAGTDGRCRMSVPRLAASCALHRLTVTRYLRRLVANGFIAEHKAARGRVGREVIECAGPMVEFSRDELRLGDPFALLLLLRTMGETFVAKIDSIAASAHISRDTVDRYLASLEAAKRVVRQRVSRSEYRYLVAVPAGTSAESDGVRSADSPLRKLAERAAAIMRRTNAER